MMNIEGMVCSQTSLHACISGFLTASADCISQTVRRAVAVHTGRGADRSLAEFGFPKNVSPTERLDADFERLLLSTNEPLLLLVRFRC